MVPEELITRIPQTGVEIECWTGQQSTQLPHIHPGHKPSTYMHTYIHSTYAHT